MMMPVSTSPSFESHDSGHARGRGNQTFVSNLPISRLRSPELDPKIGLAKSDQMSLDQPFPMCCTSFESIRANHAAACCFFTPPMNPVATGLAFETWETTLRNRATTLDRTKPLQTATSLSSHREPARPTLPSPPCHLQA